MKGLGGGKSHFMRLMQGKFVYISLAAALLMVGSIGALKFVDQPDETTEKSGEEMVEQVVTNQPDDRATTTTTTQAATTATTTTTAGETAPDLYVLPLSNTVQKPFSAEAPLYSVTMKNWQVHTGVDFAGETGQKVKAIARGTVVAVETDPLWGETIVIDHSVGVISRYCGVESSVRVGDEVEVAEVIGTLSEVPCESAQPPHLHLEMSIDQRPVDPVEAIAIEVRYAETTEE